MADLICVEYDLYNLSVNSDFTKILYLLDANRATIDEWQIRYFRCSVHNHKFKLTANKVLCRILFHRILVC